MSRLFPLALAVLMSVGCAGGLGQVPVKGKSTEVVALVGDWAGEYQARDERRIGKIEFQLEMGRHTGNGKVFVGADDQGEGGLTVGMRTIEVAGDQIRGRVARYQDVMCECAVETEFTGRIDGNTISGTFTATYPDTAKTETGSWQMTRRDS